MSAPGQRVRWHPVRDAQELAQQACERVLRSAEAAIAARGIFSIVLAGGGTPRACYERLRAARTDWSRWRIWFGDERCLPPGHRERNSRMAGGAWLDHVPLGSAAVHTIAAERGAVVAAGAYAEELSRVDEFDCVLLGLGEDGHTASLFPGDDWGVTPGSPDALAVHSAPKPPPERISMSAARLSRARCVLFLVAGQSKRRAVSGWHAGEQLPAAAIAPQAGVDVLVEAALLQPGASD